MSYSLVCEKKNMFSIYASLHSDSSFDENDMLSSSDEDNDDYKNHDTNYHTILMEMSVLLQMKQ